MKRRETHNPARLLGNSVAAAGAATTVHARRRRDRVGSFAASAQVSNCTLSPESSVGTAEVVREQTSLLAALSDAEEGGATKSVKDGERNQSPAHGVALNRLFAIGGDE